jgi:hypothetical protein
VLGTKHIKLNVQFIRTLALAFAVLFTILYGSHASAQSVSDGSNSIKVTPVRSDIQIAAGARQTVQVTVSNVTGSSLSVTPVTNDFVAGDDRGTPALILDADKFAPSHSLKRFMGPLKTATIPAGQSKTFDIVITVPASAQAGGYFGAVRFAPSDPDSGGQVNLSASVASLILLTVPGDAVERLSLSSFDVQQKGVNGTSFRTPDELGVSFSFANQGNLQIGPFGKISVKKGDKIVSSVDFNEKNPRDVILPDSDRRWDVPLDGIEAFGHYDIIATFTYGTKNQTIEVTKSFWVIPTWVIITAIASVVGLLLTAALIVFFVIRSRKRRYMPKNNRRR